MDSDCNKPLEMPALGRSFHLGMLYDCRSDQLIPGLTFWDKEKLDSDMRVTPKPNTWFETVASDSVSEKASSLGVDAALKASFLSGLVKVQGSAKYLDNNRRSKKQARVALQYKTTTVFKQLTMNQLGRDKINHHELIDKGLATHVVTAILYGAQAVFVFDQETSEDKLVQDIQGNLEVMIKKIPFISIDGKGALKMEDRDKEKVNKFSCTFYGDFCLDKSPTTFEESVKVYQDLPKLLGLSGENVVPVMVHLLPLSIIDSKASKLVRHISLRLVSKAECILEDLSELDMRCNDALKSHAAQNFSHISKKVKIFNALCSEFRLGLQGTLATQLPLIRGGGKDEAALAAFLKKAVESPFNSHCLNLWMDGVDLEANTLKTLTNFIKNTEVVSSENSLTEKVCGPEKALVFVFTSLESAEPYLKELENHLEGILSNTSRAEPKRWYSTKDVIDQMRRKAKVFGDFADNNKDHDRKSLQFLAVGLTNENHKGATIYLYEHGFLTNENFELPFELGSLTLGKATANSVSLQFSAPSTGAENVCRYRVEFCEKGQEQWNQQLQAEAGETTVRGLSPNTEYSFRVRAVTKVGVSPAVCSDTSMKTLPCSPPEEPTATSTSTEIFVRWRRPAEVGPGAHILRYIVEYSETVDRVQWRKEVSDSEEKVISGLQPQTEYTLRVFCDCGEDGKSSESSLVRIRTKTFRPVEDFVKENSKISSGIPEVYKLSLKAQELSTPGYRKYVFGKESQKEVRFVILFGPVGSGKTTLINAMINYVLGVKWADSFRFTLCEEQSTSETVMYQINHQEGFQINYSLIIFDTPGLGSDEGGVRNITDQIYGLLNAFGNSSIHALCFVVQSPSSQLSALESFLSMFDRDAVKNMMILVTFADVPQPPVLEVIKAAGVPCSETEEGLPVHFQFNNSALFTPNQSSAKNIGEMFWDMGNTSMNRFFSELEKNKLRRLISAVLVLQKIADELSQNPALSFLLEPGLP